MSVLIPAVLVSAVLIVILGPFFRQAPGGGIASQVTDDLLEREEMLLAERLDVEYDYQMGKLSYDEYRRLTELWEADIRKLGEGDEGVGFFHRLEQELHDRLQRLDSREGRSPGHAPGQKEGIEVERSVKSGSSGTSRAGTP